MHVRAERPQDRAAIRRIHEAAFPTPAEADLVDALRAAGHVTLALVGEVDGIVVGHIVFSPMTIELPAGLRDAVGLAPVAVLPDHHGAGIGSALIRAGIDELVRLGHERLFVLGHAGYYPRFGFVPASRFGVTTTYEVPDEVWMARELRPGALEGCAGLARFQAEFDGV